MEAFPSSNSHSCIVQLSALFKSCHTHFPGCSLNFIPFIPFIDFIDSSSSQSINHTLNSCSQDFSSSKFFGFNDRFSENLRTSDEAADPNFSPFVISFFSSFTHDTLSPSSSPFFISTIAVFSFPQKSLSFPIKTPPSPPSSPLSKPQTRCFSLFHTPPLRGSRGVATISICR
eukprot:Sdes_comp18776_c1_seq1m9178